MSERVWRLPPVITLRYGAASCRAAALASSCGGRNEGSLIAILVDSPPVQERFRHPTDTHRPPARFLLENFHTLQRCPCCDGGNWAALGGRLVHLLACALHTTTAPASPSNMQRRC